MVSWPDVSRKQAVRAGAAAIIAISVLVCLELLAAVFFLAGSGRLPWFGPGAKGEIPVDALQVAEAVFHPYSGYVLRPGREGEYLDGHRWRANNRGYHNLIAADGSSCCDYPYVPAEDEIVVGVFGGSVGAGYSLSAQVSDGLAGLARDGRWDGAKVRVLNLALPGYKQPQQLMTLAYYLNLGQHFDVVINIDGFNEAVTTFRNWDSGMAPLYPADTLWGAWGRQLDRQETPKSRRSVLGRYQALAARADRTAAREARIAIWKLFLEARAGWRSWRSAKNLSADAGKGVERAGYFLGEAKSPLPAGTTIWDVTVRSWVQASVAMADLSARHGAAYIHVLQPNQWDRVTGSYTPIDAAHPYEWVVEPVNEVYARMRAAAGDLEASGVRFLDASRIFEEETSSEAARRVYVDDCCHYTQAGNERLFDATVAELLRGSGAD